MMDLVSSSGQKQPLVLKAEQLEKTYAKGGNQIQVVRGISLQIRERDRIAIMGASGVGKSTLLHLLGTLDPPTSGRLLDEKGRDLYRLSERDLAQFRNRSLGFIFQFHYLLPEFSALENVMMPALIAGYSRQAAKEEAERLLQLVGLCERLEHRPSELSGGEQQRVAVARAVVLRPRLLLADELTGNLDSYHRGQVMDLLLQLGEATSVAILLVTHDLEVAKKMQQQWVMRDGRFA